MTIMKYISTWGIVAVLAHTAFVVYIFSIVEDCLGMFCETGILLAVLPWFFLSDNFIPIPFYNDMVFWSLVALDTLLIYFAFATLQKFLKRKK